MTTHRHSKRLLGLLWMYARPVFHTRVQRRVPPDIHEHFPRENQPRVIVSLSFHRHDGSFCSQCPSKTHGQAGRRRHILLLLKCPTGRRNHDSLMLHALFVVDKPTIMMLTRCLLPKEGPARESSPRGWMMVAS